MHQTITLILTITLFSCNLKSVKTINKIQINQKKMTKKLAIVILTGSLLASCKETPKQENLNATTIEAIEKTTDEIVISSSTDKNGKKLEMIFNNTKDIVTLNFNGENIELVGQRPASGMWYKNDNYELRGKGENVKLTKNGKTVFNK